MDRNAASLKTLAGRKVLVTGAGGFIGSHLVERLVSLGAEVAGLDRERGRLDHVAVGSVRFLPCDLGDAGRTMQAVGDFAPEVVLHLAAHPDSSESYEQAKSTIESNAVGTLNVLEALSRAGGALLIYGDSCKVYGNSEVPYREAMPMHPNSAYAIAKAAGWELCGLYSRVHGLPTVSVRPTLIYGPRQAFNLIDYVVGCVLDGKAEVRIQGGEQTRDPLYIDDAVDAYLGAAASGKRLSERVINIGGGRERSVRDMVAEILSVMDADLPIVSDTQAMRPTEILRSFTDNAEAGEMLGWRPNTNLRDGLGETIRYLIAARTQAVAAN